MGPTSISRTNTTGTESDRSVLVLEPYYGGSHKRFLGELSRHLPYTFSFLTLPARKWKWRMRFSAPWYAELLKREAPGRVDAILCSTFVDVAALRSLAPPWVNRIPILTYFHENQFAYPVQVEDERDFHFGLTNYTTALASDGIAFNSSYNLRTFLEGVRWLEKKAPDMKLGMAEVLEERAVILPPGLDFSGFDEDGGKRVAEGPVIVWNHRWEHDKDPETFFESLYNLADRDLAFKLIVLGQSFQRRPAVFDEAAEKLAGRIIHFGYLPERAAYLAMLAQGDLVVSTARHEFYGYSVIEAVRAGCRPLLPDRLSYPGLFPAEYLYSEGGLAKKLARGLEEGGLARTESRRLTDPFSWDNLAHRYLDWFESCW